ncbi:hypothetical protein [Nocardia asiatica]|uniref:hypothetical protein n=1 Tax=Nocardia asiatica TaxID=209252 RepID=UPI0024581B5D|nr:hypothetical protein [Nocardia asiatica]
MTVAAGRGSRARHPQAKAGRGRVVLSGAVRHDLIAASPMGKVDTIAVHNRRGTSSSTTEHAETDPLH